MNCKPGDLAVVVHERQRRNVGRIVRCIRIVTDSELVDGFRWEQKGHVAWLCESEGSPLWWSGERVMRRAIADYQLIPIRDPGDDARDESLDWLPVPSKEGMPV